MRGKGKRVVLTAAALALATAVATLFALKEPIRDRWYLWKLERAAPEERTSLIELLVDRKCAAVTPYLLKEWRDGSFERSMGMTLWINPVELLESLGPAVIPHLAHALQEENGPDPVVFQALSKFGSRASPALANLVSYLDRKGDKLDLGALDVVSALGPEASAAVPALLRLFPQADESVRCILYQTLKEIGPGARAAVPLLLAALNSEKEVSLVMAAEALESIDPGRPEVLAAAIASLQEVNKNAGEYGVKLLAKLGPMARAAVPDLVRLLQMDPSTDVVLLAAKALDQIDPDRGADECRKLLAAPAKDFDDWRTVVALAGLRSRCDVAVPALIELTRDQNVWIVLEATNSLGSLGAGAAPAIPRLMALCHCEDHDLVQAAAMSLAEIGIASKEVLAALVDSIPEDDDGSPEIASAFQTLSKQATDSRPVVEVLIGVLGGDRKKRVTAIRALENIGPPAAAAVPALQRIEAEGGDAASDAHAALGNIIETGDE